MSCVQGNRVLPTGEFEINCGFPTQAEAKNERGFGEAFAFFCRLILHHHPSFPISATTSQCLHLPPVSLSLSFGAFRCVAVQLDLITTTTKKEIYSKSANQRTNRNFLTNKIFMLLFFTRGQKFFLP
jgi:hypothetical protein